MTCCVAALCNEGKSLILIADRMIGTWAIEAELEISKLRKLSTHWWVLFAGDDISPVFDIIDWTRVAIAKKCEKAKIADDRSIPIDIISEAMRESYERKRLSQAETLYLAPIGWDLASFNAGGHSNLPDFLEIKGKIADYTLGVELLVCGFSSGTGYMLSLVGNISGGIVNRHDVPGFHSIGSGSAGANYMLYYRELSYKSHVRVALYYAMEAKLFGEQAGGVSEGTDVYIATSDGKFIQLDEQKSVEERLGRVWQKLRPRWMGKESREILNAIPELLEFELIPEPKKKEGAPGQVSSPNA